MSRVKFTDRQQADLTEMQALADSAEDNGFGLVNALLFSSDYRVEGGLVAADAPASGVVHIDPGVFVKADGKFYKMSTQATANILTGAENQNANIWGTGVAADPANPRKDIIVVSHQFVESNSSVKNFIDDSVTPPVQFSQSVNTRKNSAPIFAVLHGTPSATPSEPAIPSGFMKLATIDVPALATTILTANITNNLNVDIKSLEKLQQASQAQAAFSDYLHSDGVYFGVLGALAVSETSPQSMGVSVSTGIALKDGVTARVSTVTTVPVDAASFFSVAAENVTFNVDTKVLNTNGTPPHKIRAGTVVVAGYAEGVDYTIDYALGTITRLGGGSIAPGGTVSVNYDYYLPRIDRIELLVSNGTPQSITGTPAQSPVAPVASPNTITLAYVSVSENAVLIVDADISDERIYLPDMDEVVAARGIHASLLARFIADEAATAAVASDLSTHEGDNITPSNAVHGIQQGTGNGFDADTVDSQHAADLVARANHTGTQAPSTISPQGTGSTLDADMVDGIHASVTPEANKLLALDGSSKLPVSVIPNILGNSVRSKLIIRTTPAFPFVRVSITADILSVQGLSLSGLSVTADMTILGGPGGLDTGAEAPSTWYAIHVIANNAGTLVAGLLSLSATAPTLPVGYTRFVRVGWVRNDASSNFMRFYAENGEVLYEYPAINVISFGGPTGVTTVTTSLAEYIPPGTGLVIIDANAGATSTSTPGGTSSAFGEIRADADAGYRGFVSAYSFDASQGRADSMHYAGMKNRVSSSQSVGFRISISTSELQSGVSVYISGYVDPQ